MHMLAGLKKGDSISISRESLPGAVLFPGIKYKEPKVPTEEPEPVLSTTGITGSNEVPNVGDDSDLATSRPDTVDPVVEGENGSQTLAPTSPDSPQRPSVPPSQSHIPTQVHRFLVVTRERFIVLDSGGSGIGSTATVKSNHHLTEVSHFNPSHFVPWVLSI